MSIYTITLGSAFEVDAPVEGNVRNYTDVNGGHWLGHDTHDVVYACCESCRDEVLDGINPEILSHAQEGEFVRLDTVRSGEPTFDGGNMLYADTVEFSKSYGDDYGDSDVYCGACEVLIHEGTESAYDHDIGFADLAE